MKTKVISNIFVHTRACTHTVIHYDDGLPAGYIVAVKYDLIIVVFQNMLKNTAERRCARYALCPYAQKLQEIALRFWNGPLVLSGPLA